MKYLFVGVMVVFGFLVGAILPDVDHLTSFLTHRSIVTHGAIIPVGLFLFALSSSRPLLRLFLIGLCVALAIHFAFDLFPRRWVGLALIHIPSIGHVSPTWSVVWLATSMVVCLYLAFYLVQDGFEAMLTGVGLVVGFGYLSATERVFWQALLVLAGGILLVMVLPSSRKSLVQQLRRHVTT